MPQLLVEKDGYVTTLTMNRRKRYTALTFPMFSLMAGGSQWQALLGAVVREEPAPVTEYTRQIRGMHVYDSVIVLDKDVVGPPDVQKTGKESF